MKNEVKKLRFYVPALMLATGIAFSPLSTMEVRAEDEVLYEDTKDDYTQEPSNGDTVENTNTGLPENNTSDESKGATADNNDNEAINGDPNHYFDDENYDPSTDPSDNPGEYIPDDVKDEVDRKLKKRKTPKTPDTPQPEIPKTGLDGKDVGKATAIGVSSAVVLAALADFLKKYVGHRIAVKEAKSNGSLIEKDLRVKSSKRKYQKIDEKKLSLK